MKKTVVAVLLCVCMLTGLAFAAETDYPKKEIELTAAYAPGAGTDLAARMIAENSKKLLGQDIMVVNKPGGGGRVAATLTAKAKPDGYALASVDCNIIVLKPHMEKVLYKFDDFTYITRFGVLNLGIVVPFDSPLKSFKDLLAYAKANPDKATLSNVGEGSTGHLCTAALSQMEKVTLKPIPFDGAATAVTAALGGHVTGAAVGFSGFAQHLRAKKVRLLAIMGDQRMQEWPDVPTLKELGYPLALQAQYAIVGPKALPDPVVKKLQDAFNKALASPAYVKLAKEIAIYEPVPLYGDALKDELAKRNVAFAALVKKLGMETK